MENVDYSYRDLANQVFPRRFEKVQNNINKASYHLKEILGDGMGVKFARQTVGLEKDRDFPGLYFFIDEDSIPMYVGNSQEVINRCYQHVKGGSHNSSNLAYKIVKEERGHLGQRDELNIDEGVERLLRWKIAFIEIQNPVERYLFEAFCIMKFETPYNSFETH